MKTITKFLATAIVLLLLSTISFAQTTNFTTSGASATIVAPITIEHFTDLEFGDVAVSAVDDGTVILDPNGNSPADRTPSGGVTLPNVSASLPLAAMFVVSGIAGYTYEIEIPTTDIILYHATVPTETMIVNAFTSTPSGTGTLDITLGTETLYVGATLNVTHAQLPGHYVTDANGFLVTVNYN
jgi:hypothetical protein